MASTLDGIFRSFGNKVETPVRDHLKNVYGCLAGTTLAATVGAYTHMYTDIMSGYSMLTPLASIGVLLYLMFTPDDPKNLNMRRSLLGAFGFFTGLGLGPLLDMVIRVDPTIISTAFLATCVVFGCFSMSAMYAQRYSYIMMGGTLMSVLSTFVLLGFINIFFRSPMLFQIRLYGGLLLFCGFVLYDTQLIMEKCRAGDRDYIRHSLDLFIDAVSIFRHIAIILMQKESDRDNRRRKRN